MLLATSMVLSSVSVGTFADELIFEPEVSATTEAGEDEAYFGDDIVVDEQNEEDGAADETFFADEVIEDDQVNDDVIAEDSAADQEAYAFEEPIVDNSDVYEAIANEGETYADTETTGQVVAQGIDITYDGQEHTIKVTKTGATDAVVVYAKMDNDTDPAPIASSPLWTTKEPKFKNATNGTLYYFVGLMQKNDIIDVSDRVSVTIASKAVTASFKDQSFVFGNYTKDMDRSWALTDIEFEGLIDGEEPASVLEFTTNYSSVAWKTVDANSTTIDKLDVGTYTSTLGQAATANYYVSSKANPDQTRNYSVTFSPATIKVEITKLPVTVEPKNTSWEYQEADAKKKLKATVTSPAALAGYNATFSTFETAVGEYQAKVTGLAQTLTGDAADATTPTILVKNLDITPKTINYEVTKKKRYIGVRVADNKSVTYGTSVEDLKKSIKVTDLYWFTKNDAGVYTPDTAVTATQVTGTPQFDTTYEQFSSVVLNEAGDAPTYGYRIWYTGGLKANDFDVIAEESGEKNLIVTPTYVTVEADETVVGVNEEPVELTDQYTLKDYTGYKGGAAALKNDIDAGRIKVYLATKPEKPSAVGTYPVTITLEDNTTRKNAFNNYKWDVVSATEWSTVAPNASGKPYTTKTDDDKYVVAWGDFKLTFSDYEGKADGKEHGIVVDPDPLPTGVVVYYGKDKTEWQTAKTAFEAATDIADKNAAIKSFTDVASTNMPTRKEAGTTTVYYLATSTDYKTLDDLAVWGHKTITLLDGAEGDAKEVEKLIDEAAKKDAEGNYDPEKVKAAEDAYNALSDAAKKEVSSASKKKLDDAVAAVKTQEDTKAAKAVEDAIDKLPAATEATAKDKEAADAAKEAYDKLTDDQKKLVPADKVKKMNDVKAAADEAAEKEKEEADKKAAKAVEDEIDALPDPDKATADDKAAADKAAEDLAALTDEQKALVPQEKQDKVAAVKAAADKAAEKKAADQAEADKVTAMINDLKSSKPGEGKSNTEDARKAYDALTDDQKALVPEDAKKELETSEQAYAKDRTFTSGEGIYRVLSNGDVTYLKPVHPDATYIEVPNQVKKGGRFFKVIKISSQAFKGCSKVTKIWAGKNIVSIGSYAFKGATGLKKLILRSKDIKSGKVENAFTAGGKDKGASLTVQVWSDKMADYESLFKGEGGLNSAAKLTAI